MNEKPDRDRDMYVFFEDDMVTCPKCGSSTIIEKELDDDTQMHRCLNAGCMYAFWVTFEEELESEENSTSTFGNE